MPHIAPSILAADFAALGQAVTQTAAAGAKYLHLDVMDGIFVPNITFGAPIIASLLPYKSGLIFDTHLMIADPIRYVEDFAKAGSDYITVHIEAAGDLPRTLAAIRKAGAKPGISIKPSTPIEGILPYINDIDLLLIMSVEPGFGGQSFMSSALGKIRAARKILPPHVLISVDGGINAANAPKIIAAGADILVAGSAVYGHKGGIAAGIASLTP
jgi:ribulose-phosphate 3-epimerase